MSVTVIYAANDQAVGAGSTVGELRRLFTPAFNIPEGAVARVNGEDADESDVPQDGEKLVFLATTGEKG
jgi:hypothetical protein